MSLHKSQKVMIKEILAIIYELAHTIKYLQYINESYLHHSFSHLLQNKFDLMNLSKDRESVKLHPEWSTYRDDSNMVFKYRRYSWNNGCLIPDHNGSEGHIDFTIGNYEEPYLGIEFKWAYGWDKKRFASDFLKCLDRKLPFGCTISYNVILRDHGLLKGGYFTRFFNSMNEAYHEAIESLGKDVCDDTREVYIFVTEIGNDNQKRHWHIDRIRGLFKEGLVG